MAIPTAGEIPAPLNFSPTKLGMVIEDLEQVLAPPKLLEVWRVVSPLGGADNLGVTIPLNLKPP